MHARKVFALAVIAGLATLAMHAALPRTTGIIDDGGITLRYAERIALGIGFDYDATDPINGATNPLYTFVLAGMLFLGATPWLAVQSLGIACMAGAVGLATYTMARYWSMAAGVFVACALATNGFLAIQMLSGMESPLTLLLCVALLHAWHTRSELYAGLCLGLLIANKLDGAAAALGYSLAYLTTHRRLPWRAILFSAVAAAPVALLVLHRFGSIVPGAVWTKYELHATEGFDPAWMVDGLRALGSVGSVVWLAVLSLLALRLPALRSSLVLLWTWLIVHVAAYSSVDLGAPYPWYLVAPLVLCILLSAFTIEAGLRARLLVLSANQRGLVAMTIVCSFCALTFVPRAFQMLSRPSLDFELSLSAQGDLARQTAGAWLRAKTSATEVLASAFGLPAFEYGGPVYDTSGLNNPIDDARARSAAYWIAEIEQGMPEEKLEARRLAAFFRFGSGAFGYAIYASSTSELARAQVSYLPGPGADYRYPPASDQLKAANPRAGRRLDEITGRLTAGKPIGWARAR